MKGITPIVAVTILILITIAAAGAAFIFLRSFQSQIQESGGGALEGLTRSSQILKIESVSKGRIFLRNSGSKTFVNPMFYFEGKPVNVSGQSQCESEKLCLYTIQEDLVCEGSCSLDMGRDVMGETAVVVQQKDLVASAACMDATCDSCGDGACETSGECDFCVESYYCDTNRDSFGCSLCPPGLLNCAAGSTGTARFGCECGPDPDVCVAKPSSSELEYYEFRNESLPSCSAGTCVRQYKTKTACGNITCYPFCEDGKLKTFLSDRTEGNLLAARPCAVSGPSKGCDYSLSCESQTMYTVSNSYDGYTDACCAALNANYTILPSAPFGCAILNGKQCPGAVPCLSGLCGSSPTGLKACISSNSCWNGTQAVTSPARANLTIGGDHLLCGATDLWVPCNSTNICKQYGTTGYYCSYSSNHYNWSNSASSVADGVWQGTSGFCCNSVMNTTSGACCSGSFQSQCSTCTGSVCSRCSAGYAVTSAGTCVPASCVAGFEGWAVPGLSCADSSTDAGCCDANCVTNLFPSVSKACASQGKCWTGTAEVNGGHPSNSSYLCVNVTTVMPRGDFLWYQCNATTICSQKVAANLTTLYCMNKSSQFHWTSSLSEVSGSYCGTGKFCYNPTFSCQSCSTACDGVCQAKPCYGTDLDCDVNGGTTGACCGNSRKDAGETCNSCPADAVCSTGTYCPATGDCVACSTECNGVCQAKSCYPSDLDCDSSGGATGVCCGNGRKDGTETCNSCPADAPCTAGRYCPATGDCAVCSTLCNGVCQAPACYGTDPDCTATGTLRGCCGNAVKEITCTGYWNSTCPETCSNCLVDSPCSSGTYCPGAGECIACSTACDGICRGKTCSGTDLDCDANGNLKECCGNGMCANAETCAGCPADCKCVASLAGSCHDVSECIASDGTCYYNGFSVDSNGDGRSEICSGKVFTDPDTLSTLCTGKQTWTYLKHYNNAGTPSCTNDLRPSLNTTGNYWCTASTRNIGYNKGASLSGAAGTLYPGSLVLGYSLPTTALSQTLSFVYFANTTTPWAGDAFIIQVDHPTGTWSMPVIYMGTVCNQTATNLCYGYSSGQIDVSGLNFATSGTLRFKTYNISGSANIGGIISQCSATSGCFFGCEECRATMLSCSMDKLDVKINEWWAYSKGTAWSWLSNTCCGDDLSDLVCSGVCVNKWTNINNCGACGVRCTGTTDTCVAGVCKCGTNPACASGTCVSGACV